MSNPYRNPPVIREGSLTFVWDTNAPPNDYELSPESDSITYHAKSTGNTFRYEHARIGKPVTDFPKGDEIAREGYVGIYSLNRMQPVKL